MTSSFYVVVFDADAANVVNERRKEKKRRGIARLLAELVWSLPPQFPLDQMKTFHASILSFAW